MRRKLITRELTGVKSGIGPSRSRPSKQSGTIWAPNILDRRVNDAVGGPYVMWRIGGVSTLGEPREWAAVGEEMERLTDRDSKRWE